MTARLYLRPCSFGDGVSLAGGLARFNAVELTIRDGPAITRRERHDWTALPAVAATMAPELRPAFEQIRTYLAALPGPVASFTFARPSVVGILNITPDSFSDGGHHATAAEAAGAARAMITGGAALIDIGGESTRPRAPLVSLDEELARIGPVLDVLGGTPFSIDTRKAAVMRCALDAGAVLVNDVSALTYDPAALAVVAARGCPVVLMHAQGTPQTMQDAPVYDDMLLDVYDWLETRIAICVAAGVDRARIIVDPGIGFGKTLAHNLELLRGLGLLHGLGCPIMLGVSRKKMIGRLSGAEVADRLPGSLTFALQGLAQGVQLLRVHDVAATVQAVKVWEALQ